MYLKEEEGNVDRRKMAAASKQPKETLISFVTTIAVRGRRTNIGCQKCRITRVYHALYHKKKFRL